MMAVISFIAGSLVLTPPSGFNASSRIVPRRNILISNCFVEGFIGIRFPNDLWMITFCLFFVLSRKIAQILGHLPR
jgi:hypothetical protein